MRKPDKRETVKPKPAEEKIAEKPVVVTPAPDKTPEPAPAPKPHERYEHPERGA